MQSTKIGIDLGTTYSCVSVIEHGKVEIIINDIGNRTTPSYVAFTDSGNLIGECAKYQAFLNAENTVFDSKRLIGRRFDDPNVQADMKHWPFDVVNDGGMPKIKIVVNGVSKLVSPEEISSMVLTKMKETAEAYLGTSVTDAVITVPAYFSNAQRLATKVASAKAGLNVLHIFNEPTAAALAYGLDKLKDEKKKNVLVFDLGGGTLDVTVLSIEKGHFEVKSTSGNTHLGGQDIDNRLLDCLVKEFEKQYKNMDLSSNKRALSRLRTAAEQAKRTLSVATQTSVVVDALFNGIDFQAKLTRARLEEICSDLFLLMLQPVEKALGDAKLDKSAIDEIVLAGGSTRIPKVQKLLQDFFNGKSLNKSINPDEAIAYGAAVQAGLLGGDTSMPLLQLLYLKDVTPISLGISTGQELNFSKVVDRNTTLPVKKTNMFCTLNDNQTRVLFSVYEGEHALAKHNNFLGEFVVSGIPPAPAGSEKFDVTFEIDNGGILNVSAVNQSTGKKGNITITLSWK